MATTKALVNGSLAMAATSRPAVAPFSTQKAAFFGTKPSVMQRAPQNLALRARQAVKVEARSTAKAGQQVQVDIEKPLGLQLEQGKNGLKVKSASGNAAKAGISPGDTVIYTSSFFGDEL
jgi:predicted metalloprotease with PDZ domain